MDSKVETPAGKRRPPNAGKGRVKGVPNKLTKDVKAMILQALSDAGGAAYLLAQAHDNPNAFLTLVGKVLPLTLAGDSDNPVAVAVIERRIVKPA
jgi:hypothetical protein